MCDQLLPRRMPNRWGGPMNFISMMHIPLTSAYLCPNCSCIGNCAERCPACASSALLSLAGVLDRNHEEESEISFERVHAFAA